MRSLSTHARLSLGLFAHAALALTSSTAFACPNCITGQLARTSVFDGDFVSNLLAIASPLVVLAAITTLLYRIELAPPKPTSTNLSKDLTP